MFLVSNINLFFFYCTNYRSYFSYPLGFLIPLLSETWFCPFSWNFCLGTFILLLLNCYDSFILILFYFHSFISHLFSLALAITIFGVLTLSLYYWNSLLFFIPLLLLQFIFPCLCYDLFSLIAKIFFHAVLLSL